MRKRGRKNSLPNAHMREVKESEREKGVREMRQ